MPGKCIEWQGARSARGYGQTWDKGKVVYLHRLAWEETNGRTLCEGEQVRHSCDNPPCFNPEHLLVGTHADNMRDAIERGRLTGRPGFPPELVASWVERYRSGERTKALASEHGCHPNAVAKAIRKVDPGLTRSQHGRRRW